MGPGLDDCGNNTFNCYTAAMNIPCLILKIFAAILACLVVCVLLIESIVPCLGDRIKQSTYDKLLDWAEEGIVLAGVLMIVLQIYAIILMIIR